MGKEIVRVVGLDDERVRQLEAEALPELEAAADMQVLRGWPADVDEG